MAGPTGPVPLALLCFSGTLIWLKYPVYKYSCMQSVMFVLGSGIPRVVQWRGASDGACAVSGERSRCDWSARRSRQVIPAAAHSPDCSSRTLRLVANAFLNWTLTA